MDWSQLDMLLLAALRAGPLHGYSIIEGLRSRTEGMLNFTEGTVYPALRRLEDAGLLASRWSKHGGRVRRVYRLTRTGRAALGERERDWRALVRVVDAVLST